MSVEEWWYTINVFNTHNVNLQKICINIYIYMCTSLHFLIGKREPCRAPLKNQTIGLIHPDWHEIYPSNYALIFLNFASRISKWDPYQHCQDPTSIFLEQNAQNTAHLLHRDGHYASECRCFGSVCLVSISGSGSGSIMGAKQRST